MESCHVKSLEDVVAKVQDDPTLLYHPDLMFFKEFLLSCGAKVPPAGQKIPQQNGSAPSPKASSAPAPSMEEEEEEEPEEAEEPEEEDPERLPEDAEPYPEQGPKGGDGPKDEDQDNICDLKAKAAEDVEDGKLEDALEKYTQIMKLGDVTAMLYAKRADLLLKLKRPNACIADTTAAIEINPDSAKAYRIRGKAHRKLGHWEEAHKDLSTAQSIDFDDDVVDMQKFVDAKWKKISEKRNKKRLRDERIAKKQKEADMKARKEAAQKAYEEAKKAECCGGFPGGMGGMGGMPGMPGMPAGFDPSMLGPLLQDPELLAAMQNPKIAAALQEILQNPGNMAKYQDDPDIMSLVQKLMGKMGGMGVDMESMFGGASAAAAGDAGSSGPTVEEVPQSTGVEEID